MQAQDEHESALVRARTLLHVWGSLAETVGDFA
jgi:hypothetical protein